jgi:hypothetical protein
MPALVALHGKTFGRLTVQARCGADRHGKALWLCLCSCGTKHVSTGQALTDGSTRSCGCFNREQKRAICVERNTTHGMSDTPVYHVWVNMLTRCYNKSSKGYRTYGAKGIRVCKRWRHNFAAFLEDLGEPPTTKHTIERINTSLGYRPNNCRWATMKEQQNNRTNNHAVTFNGRTQNLGEWADQYGLPKSTLLNRLGILGWSIEKALTTPKRK